MSKPGIIIYDIETLPMTVTSWGLFKPMLSHQNIKQDWSVVTIAWKRLGESKIHLSTVTDFPSKFKKDIHDDSGVLKKFRDAVGPSDILVGHNIDKFDTKKLNARLLKHGLPIFNHNPSVDTLKVARSKFAFSSNRLDYLAVFLGYRGKISTDYSLWLSCMDKDLKALAKMGKYNKIDVKITEYVYQKLLPYIKSHPVIHFDRENIICPICGSNNIRKRGFRTTRTGRHQIWQCKDCGHEFVDRKGLDGKNRVR